MDIIQTFYDNLAAQYDKLFEDWQATTHWQAQLLDGLFRAEGFGPAAPCWTAPAASAPRPSAWRPWAMM